MPHSIRPVLCAPRAMPPSRGAYFDHHSHSSSSPVRCAVYIKYIRVKVNNNIFFSERLLLKYFLFLF